MTLQEAKKNRRQSASMGDQEYGESFEHAFLA